MNEKINTNAKVEQLTKVVLSHGEEKGLIVKDPFVKSKKRYDWCYILPWPSIFYQYEGKSWQCLYAKFVFSSHLNKNYD